MGGMIVVAVSGALPSEIGRCLGLTQIVLRDQKIDSLPPELGFLTFLTRLAMYNNRVTSFPNALVHLERLEQGVLRRFV